MFQEELAARIPEQHAALLDKKDVEDSSSTKGPSRPEPEPPHIEVNQPSVFHTYLLLFYFLWKIMAKWILYTLVETS